MNILLIAGKSQLYPTDRVRLTSLFEKELTGLGHSLNWIIQSKNKQSKMEVLKKGKNTFYVLGK